MQDRTSYSYRANTPRSNPDMYAEGGNAREARTSPYIREHSKQSVQSRSESGQSDGRKAFRAKRSKQQPAPSPSRGPFI